MARFKSIDPGGAIGWAEFSVFPSTGFELDAWGEHRYHNVFLSALWAELNEEQWDGIVLEDWRARPGIKSPQAAAERQIGAITWMCHHTKVPLYLQLPGDTLEWITVDKHKDVKRPTIELMNGEKAAGHALMALKHGLYFVHTHPEALQ